MAQRIIEGLLDRNLELALRDIDVASFSRIPVERLTKTALPNIGRIELVNGDDYQRLYRPLYEAMFHGGERERGELIVQRLHDEFEQRRHNLAPFRTVGILDVDGEAIGAAQFSVLRMGGSTAAVAPYLQYIYIRPQNRRQDMSELLHALVLALTEAVARPLQCRVPFTFFETDPPDHGASDAARGVAKTRTQIHARGGSQALMLQRQDGRVISAHVQPGLDLGEPPLTLIWVLRPSPVCEMSQEVDSLGDDLVAAYYQSLRDEGFVEENIALAESIVKKRRPGCEFILMPLADITHDMYNDID